MIYQSISQPKIDYKGRAVRVPEFVSIFQQGLNDEEEEEEDPIYGQIGEMAGTSDDYFSSTSTNDYEFNRANRKQQQQQQQQTQRGGRQYRPPYGPANLSTLTMKNPYREPYRTGPFATIARAEAEPPQLPPRDKKKLSKQIDTIKSARNRQSTLASDGECRIEIPLPDYHEDEPTPRKKTGKNRKPEVRMVRNFLPTSEPDNLYDTMRKAYDDNWRGKNRNATMISHSTVQIAKGSQYSRGRQTKCRDESNFFEVKGRATMDEDPYYSGLEARITSKKMLTRDGTAKVKGLNWMRKVLSANYINILTSKRHKKKKPSKSSAESSTDSDPYMSINDVYEPIYGYAAAAAAGNRISYIENGPLWSTMHRRRP